MRTVFIFFLLLIVGVFAFFLFRQPKKQTPSILEKSASTKAVQRKSPQENYIFVPYWTIDEDVRSTPYDKLIYFGITADKDGIVTDDDGYKQLENFVRNAGSKEKLLAVRMLNTDKNLSILKDTSSQNKIIEHAASLAKKYKFTGIVLDLEIQGLPFEKLVGSITALNVRFARSAHREGLTFGTLLYGDTFYRIRPYDVSSISKNIDRVYVMAYDFSKARSDPGPNFPLSGKDVYGYDFTTMISDFSKTVAREKLTILFGMFGYDWKIDEKGRGKELAASSTTLQLEKKLTQCIADDSCKSNVDENAAETQLQYKDKEGQHIIWFENINSKNQKIKYLQSQGLYSVGYWAYGYF